jgi:hypothetical protein
MGLGRFIEPAWSCLVPLASGASQGELPPRDLTPSFVSCIIRALGKA